MELVATLREKLGMGVKALRRGGMVPAELYGCGSENVHVSVGAKEFHELYKKAGRHTIVNLVMGENTYPALVHDVQRGYLSGDITHVDFYRVRMDEKLKAKVPIEFTGEAPAVAEKGGILNTSMLEVEVEALPKDLPNKLTVDLSTLNELHASVYVKDIKAPAGVRVLVDGETVVATVKPPVEEEKAEVETLVDVGAVKVEAEEKRAERDAEKNRTDRTGKEDRPHKGGGGS